MKNKLIAIVGVSADSQKYGNKIFVDLLQAGYKVIGVNPKKPVISGQPTVGLLSEIDQPIELVLIVTPPKISLEIIRQAANLSIKNVWLQPGAESEAVITLADKLQLNLTHHQCFMVDQGLW